MFERVDSEKLMEEVDRYLTAVDLFRALGCEPTWRVEVRVEPESSAPNPALRPASSIRLH